jgi:hypothetical protein
MPTLIKVEESLKELNRTLPNICEKLPAILLNQITNRFDKFLNFSSDNDDAVVASVSHPYFKLRWVPDAKKVEVEDLFMKTVLNHCIMPVKTDSNSSSMLSEAENSENYDKADDFFKFRPFENSETFSMSNEIEVECRKYLASSDTSLTMLHQFPFVKSTFLKYNTPLPSSGPVERICNFGQMILDPKRQRLSDIHFERALLLKVNTDVVATE